MALPIPRAHGSNENLVAVLDKARIKLEFQIKYQEGLNWKVFYKVPIDCNKKDAQEVVDQSRGRVP